MEAIHQWNILIHITLGTIALGLGIYILVRTKGTARHKRLGKLFLILMSGILFTALIGSVLFNFRPFLFILTLTAFYTSYMGMRVLQLHGKRPLAWDVSIMGVTLVLLLIYLFFEPNEQVDSKNTPVLIATIANLALNILFDLGKLVYPHQWLKRTVVQDHIVRMISSFSALLSAFSANVLPKYLMPYSQLIPSALCILLMIYFIQSRQRKTRKSLIFS